MRSLGGRMLPFVGALIVVVLAIGSFMALELEDSRVALDLAGLAVTGILTAIFAASYRLTRNALSPMCLVSIVLFLLYPFHVWMTQDSLTIITLIGSDAEVWRTRALLVAALAIPFIWFGYRSAFGARLVAKLPSFGWQIEDERASTRSKMLILYMLGFVPRFIAFGAGQGFHFSSSDQQLPELQNVLTVLSNIPILASVWFMVMGLRSRQKRLTVIGVVMLALESAWSLASGSRMRMVAPLLTAALAFSYLVKPISIKRVVLLAAAFALVLLPFLTSFRSAYFDRMSDQGGHPEASTIIESLSDASEQEPSLANGQGPFDALAERFHAATSLALIMRYTPERQDYLWGETYLMIIPQIVIPRFLWPSKPTLDQFGDTFRFEYWGLERGAPTSIAPSQLGGLWVNLHLFGCIVGSFIFGLLINIVFHHIRYGLANPSIYPKLAFALQMPVALHSLEGSLEGAIAIFAKSLLIYLVIARFLARPRSSSRLLSAR